jgi:hypothetical protein
VQFFSVKQTGYQHGMGRSFVSTPAYTPSMWPLMEAAMMWSVENTVLGAEDDQYKS